MAVKYVSDFTFAPSPPRPTARGYARGGHVQGGTAKCYARGGSVSPDVATGAVPMGRKASWNPDDAVSPGSPKRTPPGQGEKNSSAATSKFSREGRDTPQATKQSGNVERMSGYSDFHNGGRIKNLGHYAHGGKVKASGEVASGKAGTGAVKAPVKATPAGKYEANAGTPKTSPGSRVEVKSGVAKAAMGGLSRGTSHKKNAAIHAKNHAPRAPKAPKIPSLGALAAMAPPPAPMGPPMGAPPMGAPPGMGAPPMKRGGRAK